MRLKVRLGRLQLEAQEKAQSREAQLKLEIRKLEIEADKAMRLRQLELESQREQQGPFDATTSGMPHLANPSTPYSADVSKQLGLVPPFHEAEVHSYFGAFERLASVWRWPRDVWPLLIQSKLWQRALPLPELWVMY